MKTYYIYHILDFIQKDGSIGKIGCSTEPKKRINSQGYSNFEILEQHIDIYIASEREQELQKQYGYKVDTAPYYSSYNQRGVMGSIGGLSKSQAKINAVLNNRTTWANTAKFRDKEKVLYNAKYNGGTLKVRDCVYCGRTINLMNIGRHENICKLKN